MKVIYARNVNDALSQAIPYLLAEGEREESRNGTVLVAPTPVTTVYSNPRERVLFSPTRNANPFFHLMESLWMLAGRNDVTFPAFFNKRFTEYSDDGAVVHGAYGHRWRIMFGMDQIAHIVDELRAKPSSRRAVLQMWCPLGDMTPIEVQAYNSKGTILVGGMTSKDIPCNTNAYFDVRHGKLNMTVCCRSNDIIWGAYGANAVHFSILQEYIASQLGVEVGEYRQMSNNFHMYTDLYGYTTDTLYRIASEAAQTDYYTDDSHVIVHPYPIMSVDTKAWNADLRAFMANPIGNVMFNDNFFNSVVQPMYNAYEERKRKAGNGMKFVDKIQAEDWHLACTQWIANREKGN